MNPNIKLVIRRACNSFCGVLLLVSINAPAQNLFVTSGNLANFGNVPGTISEFTPGGVRINFASLSQTPDALAFDNSGNLFVTTSTGTGLGGTIQEFTPGGAQSTFATGLINPSALAFDSAGNLFVGTGPGGGIYEYTPGGLKSTFATGLSDIRGLAFDSAGDLFVTTFSNLLGHLPSPGPGPRTGVIYEFSPDGVKSTFATGLLAPMALAFDGKGDLFVADGAATGAVDNTIYKYTPGGGRSTFATGVVDPTALAFDSAGNLYVSDDATFGPNMGGIFEYTPNGVRSAFASGARANGLAFQGETLPVPEPSVLALLTVCAIVFLNRRDRHQRQ
jgi:sugar lactone lactonase YvrE